MYSHFAYFDPGSRWLLAQRCLVCVLVLLWPPNLAVCDQQQDAEVFFETSVRPLLIDRCWECHGPDEQAGLLRLDQRPDSGRAVGAGPILVPGDTGKSLLLKAVGYDDSNLQMPPDGKLSDQEIAVLSQWVRDGAFWPEQTIQDASGERAIPPAERIDSLRESHWAYRRVEAVEPPVVADVSWPKQPIDCFILSQLEQAGLPPSPAADRRTLILRAYFTLVGLPPSYDEVQKFMADESTDAFSQLVDRLLDSPHYGERWARHWLDLARFAETTGYLAGSVDTTYPYAYTYRDYVIKAFNSDKPFNRFIMEQLAADQLNLEDGETDALAALGFLTVGRKFMNRTHDIIDDRIDVVTRGFLAQSVTCARCHDHKYDPIPIADYYSLYGVFASSHEPAELPLLGSPEDSPQYPEYLAARAEKQKEVDDWLDKKRIATEEELRSRVADYLVYHAQLKAAGQSDRIEQKGRRGVLRPPAISRWQQHIEQHEEKSHPVWSVWHHFASLNAADFAAAVQQVIRPPADGTSGEAETAHWNTELVNLLGKKPPTTMIELADLIGTYLESIYQQWQQLLQADSSAMRLSDDSAEAARQVLIAADSPATLDTAQILAHLDQAERNAYNQQLSKIKAVESKHPGAPGKAMVLTDNDKPHEPVIFLRGQPGNHGAQVPRRFLQVLSHVDGGKNFSHGSGRLELAQAIASSKNPLTARVIVNRIWQQHFGVGLVRTSSDFGSRGEAPSHPELLDYMAAEFMADGWSIKRLQRRIMLSSVWQQSSHTRAEAMQIDPENRLLWRQPRRRLEFEPLRDRVLMVSGRLDSSVGGRSVAIHQDAVRRGLYAYIDREDVPSLLASFDVPSPDASQAIRSRTTVPQQALFILNSQFMHQQASSLSQSTLESTYRNQVESSANASQNSDASLELERNRIIALYRRALSRDPDEQELMLAQDFISQSRATRSTDGGLARGTVWDAIEGFLAASSQQLPATQLDPWILLSQAILASNEFAFVD